MRVNLNFTNKGQNAIGNFDNGELLEIFSRYIKTLTKHYSVDITVPSDINQNIGNDGRLEVFLENVNCDVPTFFKELSRDIKVPLKKRLSGTQNLDNVFKIEVIAN